MFCSRCGTQVDTSVRFCPNCGQDLSALTGAGGKTAPINAQPPQENETDIVRDGLKDEYELEKELGRGGMAVVYKARDKQLDREVAIKVLPFSLSFDAEFVERFQREARTAGKLEHPNIIPIYRVGKAGRVIYFVMKYIRGKSLSQVIEARGALPVPELRRLLKEATGALGYAHKHGIVHRDIKPDNIMFDEQGQAIVTDFGIAKAQSGAKLTGTGMSIGTPHYMSPEQARAQNLDGRSDIYSLGVVGYQALTGHVPFDGEDSFSIGYKHIMEELPVPALEQADQREMFAVVQKMMAKKPDDRFQNADELVAALESGGGQIPMGDLSTMRTVAIESPIKRPPAPPIASMATTPLPRASASMGKPRDTIEREDQPTKASPAKPDKPAFRPKETTPKKSYAVPIGIAAALVVVGGGLGGYLYMQKQNQPGTQQVVTNTPPTTPQSTANPDTSKAAAAPDTSKAAAPAAHDTAKAAPPPANPAPSRTPATSRTPAPARTPPATSRTPATTATTTTQPVTGAGQGTIALPPNLPRGALVRLNGQPKSGERFKVPSGQYTLEIQAQGFQTYTSRVTVQPGQTISVPVAMIAAAGTPPSGATPVAAGARDPQCSSNPTFSTTNSRKACWDTRPIANTPTQVPAPGVCTGTVSPAQVLVHVSVQGEVVGAPTVRQRSSCAAFNDAAVAQVQEITFTPAKKGTTPVDAWVVVRMVPQRPPQ